MKRILSLVLLSAAVVMTANAGDRYGDLTYEYLYGKKSNVSVAVRKMIAKDPQTSHRILEMLSRDADAKVRKLAKANPSF